MIADIWERKYNVIAQQPEFRVLNSCTTKSGAQNPAMKSSREVSYRKIRYDGESCNTEEYNRNHTEA